MARRGVHASILLADGSESFFEVGAKTADYFGITGVTPKPKTVHRDAYSYYRQVKLGESFAKVVNVPRSQQQRVPRQSPRSDNRVRIPTENVTKRGCVSTLGIKFPARARITDISHWLYWNCKVHRPQYFLTKSGCKYGVTDQTGLGRVNDGR
jgi:hypothetical protein